MEIKSEMILEISITTIEIFQEISTIMTEATQKESLISITMTEDNKAEGKEEGMIAILAGTDTKEINSSAIMGKSYKNISKKVGLERWVRKSNNLNNSNTDLYLYNFKT
jgi:hypothetical protein